MEHIKPFKEEKKTFKTYIVAFAHTTSMKGLSRIARAERLFLRILWAVAVLSFLGVAFYQVYILVNEYLQYPTVININEEVVSADNKILPPQVTVCNLNPFSSTASQEANRRGIPTVIEYRDILNQFARCDGCTDAEAAKAKAAADDLKHMAAYYQYIGKEGSSHLSHKQEMMIVKCEALSLLGFRLDPQSCDGLVTITPITTPESLNCFHFRINVDTDSSSFFLGIALTIYLDNFPSMVIPAPFTLEKSLGVLVSVDAPGTIPFNSIDAIRIPPGRWSHVELTQELRQRMKDPYGNCDDKDYVGTYQPDQMQKKYSVRACTSLCVEKRLLDDCGCKDANMITILPEFEPATVEGFPFCDDVSLPKEDFYRLSRCANWLRDTAIDECSGNCTFPCEELMYTTQTSQSRWPKKYDIGGFRDEFIKGRPYEHNFPDAETWARNPDYDLVAKNFLKVSVYHGDYRFNVYEEDRAITQSNFLSQLGGALNLWSGITVIVIMEVIDLVYHVIKDKFFPDRSVSHGIIHVVSTFGRG